MCVCSITLHFLYSVGQLVLTVCLCLPVFLYRSSAEIDSVHGIVVVHTVLCLVEVSLVSCLVDVYVGDIKVKVLVGVGVD